MEQIQITLAEVTQTAVRLRQYNQQLYDNLIAMRKQMNALEQSWQSPAATSIREKFNGMLPTFDNYREIINTYAKFLDQTVVAYEEIETAMQQHASSFI